MSAKFTYLKVFLVLLFSCLLLGEVTFGQSGTNNGCTYQVFPMQYQLYPRNTATNQASVRIKGFYDAGVSDAKLVVTIDANNDGFYDSEPASSSTTVTIISNLSDPRAFDFNYTITAGLFSYRFRLFNGNNFVTTSTSVVAGDAYYIQGQSNAEAKPVTSSDNDLANNEADIIGSIPGTGGAHRYIRVYGGGIASMPQWYIGDANKNYNQEGNLGQFGMRIGDRIVREQGIPVCIMNGAELGHPISYFQKNSTVVDGNGLNNYTRELNRLIGAGLKDHIKAVIWFQGESNTYNGSNGELLTTAQYTSAFLTLANNWDTDLGVANKFYIIQIRPGCFVFGGGETASSVLGIQDAQRQLDQSDPRISIVSTNNLPKYTGDNCHYYYQTGYRQIGDRVYTLIKRDFYGGTPGANSLTPFPSTVEFSARVGLTQEATQVGLHFSQPLDDYSIVGDIRPNFKLEGGSYNITAANIVTNPISSEKYLTLDFTKNSGTTTNPTGLTYFSNASGLTTTPALANDNGTGIGLISFFNFPLAIGILPTDPLNLRISASNGANTLKWEAENNPQFSYFIVQRSDNGTTFSDISKLQANTTTGTGNYEFTDSKPNTIRNYYRIYAMKRDGKTVMSQVVAVNNRTSSTIGITVYPNPVRDRANVGVTVKKAGMASIQIFDGAGKLVSTRKISLQKGNNMFSAGEILDQSAGIYTIRVVTEDDVFNTRIVRVK